MKQNKFNNTLCIDCILHNKDYLRPDCIASNHLKTLIRESSSVTKADKLLDIHANIIRTDRILNNCDPRKGKIYDTREKYNRIAKIEKFYDRRKFSFG